MAEEKASYQNGAEKVEFAGPAGSAATSGLAGVTSSGFFVSKVLAGILVFGVAASLVVVGVTVHFAASPSCDDPVTHTPVIFTTKSPEEEWQRCRELSAERGECLCETTAAPSTTTEAPTTTTEAPLPTGLRLPKTVYPNHYNIELTPRIYPGDDFGFDGSVEIFATCREATNQIVLHIYQLTIHDATVQVRENDASGTPLVVTSWEEDKDRHFMKLNLAADLVANQNYYIAMSFNGTHIHDDLLGFYRSSYEENGQTKWLVVTQFQRTNSRRAFPNFDEPSFKATFNATLVRKVTHSSICNMELVAQEPRGGDWVADVYNTTVKMSSYLMAFVVSEFGQRNYTSPRGTFIRIWARPDYLGSLDYALVTSTEILEALEDYTGYLNPIGKTDQIAIPDFAAGAMENWGLVTYRERGLLWNPDYSTMSDKRYIAAIIAHEFTHFWYGNLVTCDWWDDTWLNEGFATYFADFAVGLIEPTWKMDEYYMRRVATILEYDGQATSQPVIISPILEHHSELFKAFNTITYSKGGSVIRMMRYLLTEETFKAGLAKYLKAHEFSTTISDDLYSALEEQAAIDGTITWDRSKRNFSAIMGTWNRQMNHPVVMVTDIGGTIRLTQDHFLYNPQDTPAYDSPYNFQWDIYIESANASGLRQDDSEINWFYREDGNVELSEVGGGWQLVNLFQQGFFRVQYDATTWQSILDQLKADHTVIPVENRAQLIDDAFNLARGGRLDELSALKSTEYLGDETEYLPWYAGLLTRVAYIRRLFYNTPSYPALETYLYQRLEKAYVFVTWDNTDPDEHIEKYLRTIILRESCKLRLRNCLDTAITQYQQFMVNSPNPITPDFRSFVYCEGIRDGGILEYEFAESKYNTQYTEWISTEKTSLLQGMACARSTWIINKYLDMAVNMSSTTAFNYAASEPDSQAVVWEYLRAHWSTLGSRINRATILNTLVSYYSTQADLDKLERFIAQFPDSALEDTYHQLRTTVQSNIEWMAANQAPIEEWLKSVI